MKKILIICCLALAAISCAKQEYVVYDNPYAFVVADGYGMQESTEILAKASATRNYIFCLSSRERQTPLSLYYEIEFGDGLSEGVDFQVETLKGSVVFEPKSYRDTIQIKFMRHSLSKDKDNTLTIRLTGASEDVNLGVPGASARNASHTIMKK